MYVAYLGFVLNVSDIGSTSEERLDLLRSSLNHLPQEKPRLVYGLGTPGILMNFCVKKNFIYFRNEYANSFSRGHSTSGFRRN